MLCMICNTNSDSIKCTTPNKHGFAYVIHYDNNGEALHKHYRFISNDENIAVIQTQTPEPCNEQTNAQVILLSEIIGSNEPNKNELQEKWGFKESRNGSNEPNSDSSNSSSDKVSDSRNSIGAEGNDPPNTHKRNSRSRNSEVIL